MDRHTHSSKPRAGLRALAIAGVVALVSASLATTVASARSPEPQRDTRALRDVAGVPAPTIVGRRATAHPKLDGAMAALADAADAGSARVTSVAGTHGVRAEGGRVQAIVTVDARRADRVTTAIAAERGTVTGREGELLQAWLAPSSLARLARLEAVRGITQAQAPTLFAGSSVTEGLAAMTNSGDWHTAGFDGTGIKVAIVDAGFIGYTNRQATSDLPATVTIKNTVDGQTNAQINTGTQHGTGVAEIVHDVAPGAALWLVKVGTQIDLAEAVDYLIAQDVDIITTSLGWYGLTPGDGTGFFDQQVDEARAAGILWTTAASNDREVHWDGTFVDVAPGNASNNTHDFGGTNVNYFGPQDGTTDCFLFSDGQPIQVFLQWNDWTGVSKDYDLYLFRLDSGGWTQVAASERDQAGAFPRPTEFINHTAGGGAAGPECYGFLINKFQGSAADLVAVAPKVAPLHFFDRQRSLSNLADAPAAMTIAALDAQTGTYPQESYSSEGPAYGPGGSIAGGARTMDLSGYANVDTQAYGKNIFNGTSAATPHVAGAAALVMDAHPTFTLAQVESFLTGRAEDKGPAGADPKFGFGRLRLGAPPPSGAQPDGQIRVGTSAAFIGDDIYNLNGVGQKKAKSAPRGSSITFNINVQNDGTAPDSFTLLGGGSTTMYNVKYLDGATNVTSLVVGGTYTTPSLGVGATRLITVKVKVKSSATVGSKVGRLVTIISVADGSKQDAVKFVGKRS